MTRLEKLKNEDLDGMADVIMNLSVRIAKDLVKKEYGEPFEVSNFDKADITHYLKEWLNHEIKE